LPQSSELQVATSSGNLLRIVDTNLGTLMVNVSKSLQALETPGETLLSWAWTGKPDYEKLALLQLLGLECRIIGERLFVIDPTERAGTFNWTWACDPGEILRIFIPAKGV
jgi:hypothetical protein